LKVSTKSYPCPSPCCDTEHWRQVIVVFIGDIDVLHILNMKEYTTLHILDD
jgi:hypothetical protein